MSSDEEVQFVSEKKNQSASSKQYFKEDKFKESNSESDEEKNENQPNGVECLKRCKEFASITGTDNALAMFYLQDTKWDLEVLNGSIYLNYKIIRIIHLNRKD